MNGPMVMRNRPAVVEVWQVDEFNAADVAIWCGGVLLPGRGVGTFSHTGDFVHAPFGDYMVKGAWGEFYPEPERVVFSRYETVIPAVAE